MEPPFSDTPSKCERGQCLKLFKISYDPSCEITRNFDYVRGLSLNYSISGDVTFCRIVQDNGSVDSENVNLQVDR